MPAAKNIEPFANLNAAIDALGATDIKADLEGVTDDLDTCESVETMADFAANLAAARGQLESALAAIIKLQARCV
jgi:hypothetical protein